MNRLFAIVLFILLGNPFFLQAQYPSDNGLFEVDVIRGCPGTTIQITNLYTATCDCLAGCSCDFDYDGDGNFEVEPMPFEYTYADEGVYRLEILFSGTSDFITITIEDKPAPAFNVFSCAGQTVQAEITDTSYEAYEIDYGDGTVVTVNQGDPVPSHTYPDAATRTVSVRGLDAGSANNCPVSTRNITPLASLPVPSITEVTAVDASSLTLGLNTADNILYDLQMSVNNGAYSTLRMLTAATITEVVTGLDLSNNYYCFQLIAVDPCGGPQATSDVACSIQLGSSTGNNTVQLVWQTGNYQGDATLFRDGSALALVPNGTMQYDDPTLACGVSYCYQVTADFSGALSTSLPECVSGDSDTGPPPINNLSLVVTSDGKVNMQWFIDEPLVSPAIYEGFEVYRSGENNVPEIITDVTLLTYVDENVLIPGPVNYCYEIIPRDYCGNRTPTNINACVIQLTGQVTPSDEITLNWNHYEGYINGVREYVVEKAYAGGTLAEVARVQDTLFTEIDGNPDSQIIMYRVKAVPQEAGIRESNSQVLILYKSSNLHFPDAFSPDGDGLNDLFEVNARFVAEFDLMIFNRWGELIFQTNDLTESWNGVLNGRDVQEGAYVMKVRITDEAGRETRKEGSIIVVRR